MATPLKDFTTRQSGNLHQSFEEIEYEEDEGSEEYNNFIDNSTNEEEDEDQDQEISENPPNFVNNEYFNNIIDKEIDNIEEIQSGEDEEANQYFEDCDGSDLDENTYTQELEVEHSDSEEEIKPKEQRSFHMYIPKTLTPKSKRIESFKEEFSHEKDSVLKCINIDEKPINRSESAQQTVSIEQYQEYEECLDSSNRHKMLKRNSRWGSLLNKISKPGTYVPPTNKHSKESVLKNQKLEHATTESKHEAPLKPTQRIQKKEETKFIKANTPIETQESTKSTQPTQSFSPINPFKQDKTLKTYFSEPSLPENMFIDEELTQEDEEGWGTFINRNTVYNPYNYEQKPIGGQQYPQSAIPTIINQQEMQHANSSNGGSIVSNFFLPKAQEEEKKRQIKEKIEKKKEGKKQKEVEELKLQELEEQLLFYRNENEKTRRLKDELQADRQRIECEKSEFKRFLEDEREKFEKYKQEELQKLKRERRILERNIKDQQQSLSRKEHEKEVNELKGKIEKLTSEFKNEKSKLKSNIQALKTRNEQLQEKIMDLEENLKKRELERIDNNFRKKPPKEETAPPTSVSPLFLNSEETVLKSQQTVPKTTNKNIPLTVPKTETAFDIVQASKQHRTKPPYPNNHALGLLKKTFKVSDSHFTVTWETDNVGEVVTSRRDVGKGKIEILYNTGRRDVEFSNGTVKKILPDRSILIYFYNGDTKKTFEDGLVIYFFNNLKTTQITYPTGAEMYKFSNNQIETHFPGGEKEVVFPDKTVKFVDNSGVEEIWFSDGTYSRNDIKN